LAIATGQNAEQGQRQHDRAALGVGLVDEGADRGLHGEPEQPAGRGHQADCGLAPMLLGHQKHVEVGPERPAHVGEQEIDCVERVRIEAVALGRCHNQAGT
jgi:hypothetical protein